MGFLFYCLGGIIAILGVTMAIRPEQSTKEEKREMLEEVKKTRVLGIILACAGILFGVFIFILKFV